VKKKEDEKEDWVGIFAYLGGSKSGDLLLKVSASSQTPVVRSLG
jgi:hypothetical protein